MDSEPGPPPGRVQEIQTRLEAVRARLQKLRERDRDWDTSKRRAVTPSDRLKAAQRYAAEAHERVASVRERAAASGIGDVGGHERQSALDRAAAAADWQRAERTLSLLSDHERAGPAPASDGPGKPQ